MSLRNVPRPAVDDALSRDHLAQILDIAEDGILTADATGNLVLFNQGAEKIFGYAAAEVLGRPLDWLLPERFRADHGGHMADFARAPDASRRMGERRAVYGRRKDGTEFPAEISISKLVTLGGMLFTAIVRDITERRRAEEAIRRLNEDLEQRVVGRTAELAESNRQLARKNEENERTEAALRDTNRNLEQALQALHVKSDELQAMTQQLWQAAKLATVGELAASIAHELNNPLATVSLRVEAVLMQTPAGDPRRRPLEVVEQEVERMGNLVGNLLQFSRQGSEQRSTVDVAEELRRSLELVDYHLRHRRIKVVRETTDDLPPVFADPQKLRQVFLNLLTNAADAMPDGGTITVRAAPGETGAAAAVRVEFIDTGTGIAPEHLPHVLEPFYTTKEEGKGTGLGLAICRRIVQEHRGSIEITSTLGKGTTVSLLLPVAREGKARSGAKDPARTGD
jgi:PAS domain S-box-containing protein